MASVQDILDNATQETTLIGSIQALITSLLEGEIVTPTMQAKLDAIFGTQEANETTLNAIKANLETPPEP